MFARCPLASFRVAERDEIRLASFCVTRQTANSPKAESVEPRQHWADSDLVRIQGPVTLCPLLGTTPKAQDSVLAAIDGNLKIPTGMLHLERVIHQNSLIPDLPIDALQTSRPQQRTRAEGHTMVTQVTTLALASDRRESNLGLKECASLLSVVASTYLISDCHDLQDHWRDPHLLLANRVFFPPSLTNLTVYHATHNFQVCTKYSQQLKKRVANSLLANNQ
ncbi:hypothetical protein N7454_002905 [Penicillium verhagenii]|nr:hypothetical protein N7454_002905 [Penicillium verhagenii]